MFSLVLQVVLHDLLRRLDHLRVQQDEGARVASAALRGLFSASLRCLGDTIAATWLHHGRSGQHSLLHDDSKLVREPHPGSVLADVSCGPLRAGEWQDSQCGGLGRATGVWPELAVWQRVKRSRPLWLTSIV